MTRKCELLWANNDDAWRTFEVDINFQVIFIQFGGGETLNAIALKPESKNKCKRLDLPLQLLVVTTLPLATSSLSLPNVF